MTIDKNNILTVFKMFKNTYIDFEKKIDNKDKLKDMIVTWQEVFETIDYDYEQSNNDFIEASKKMITKTKYVPTIYEIIDEMRNIYITRTNYEHNQNTKKILQLSNLFEITLIRDLDDVIKDYERLLQKYNAEDIEKIIKDKANEHSDFTYTLESCLKEIINDE